MANIVNLRIDERLIHGQVAAFWTNSLNVNRLMVIDDSASKDDIQKMALKMACPTTVKLSILSEDKAVEKLNDPANYVNERIFVVVRGTKTLESAVAKGLPVKEVTVGNMSNKHGSARVYHSVCVTQEDIASFRKMNEQGIKFIAQMVPNDEAQDFIQLISKM